MATAAALAGENGRKGSALSSVFHFRGVFYGCRGQIRSGPVAGAEHGR